MRVFLVLSAYDRRWLSSRDRRCGCEGLTLHGRVFLAVLGALALPGPATAIQWPGELSGRVVDSLTRTTLGAVEVLVEPVKVSELRLLQNFVAQLPDFVV